MNEVVLFFELVEEVFNEVLLLLLEMVLEFLDSVEMFEGFDFGVMV